MLTAAATMDNVWSFGPASGFRDRKKSSPDENAYVPHTSWFLSLTSATAMRIERIEHAAGESPCDDDPGTWSFGGGAVSMVR